MTPSSAAAPEDVLTGSCLCGAVRVTLTGAPSDVTLCHCTTCQKTSGGAFAVAVGSRPAQLSLDDPTAALRFWQSGPETRRSFCSRCGTTVGFHFDDPTRDRITVWRGLFDDPSTLIPTGQIWTDSRPDWICRLDCLPGHPRGVRLP
ncbi:glutathione-dependent formaldehyde-activating, GFA [alpha proteobacterium BAL199]|jgi:hypothetical protein|nr:glutathione-dependent formaldehyde-activating, GFA [alpha proteobacterium BAL199]